MTSLHQLAQNKQLPDIQMMDQETLDWIRQTSNYSHNWRSNPYVATIQQHLEQLRNFVPIVNWFLQPDREHSIHGIRHLLRVMIYAGLIAVKTDNFEANQRILCTSAIIHDIRRQTDKEDLGHGQRAAQWFKASYAQVEDHFGIQYTDGEKQSIISITTLHDEPMTESDAALLHQFRTADALDRYVQPKQTWWPNLEYLQYKPDSDFITFALGLVIESEQRALDGLPDTEAIFGLFT